MCEERGRKTKTKTKVMLSMSKLIGKGQTNILLDLNQLSLPHGV
jgi:hypothetical protein